MTDLVWANLFVDHWEHVDPSIRRLARQFSGQQMRALNGVAYEAWSGSLAELVHPDPVEDAIGFAITVMFEMTHPELAAYRETIH